jgi:hypothetical protein
MGAKTPPRHRTPVLDRCAGLFYVLFEETRKETMTRRLKDLLFLLCLGLGIALAPIACSDGSDDPDGSVNNMTPG